MCIDSFFCTGIKLFVMENVNSKTVLLAVGALAVKYRESSFLHKQLYWHKAMKMYQIYLKLKKSEKRSRRSCWVREIFTTEQRYIQGSSNNLVAEMRSHDRKKFINFVRMCPETFDLLLYKVEPYIRKQNLCREAINPRTRLEITLRYLASGDSMVSLSYSFRVGKQTVSDIIAETCDALWNCLKDEVFLEPNEENWKKVANEFEQKWNFKNCIGAIDGKHVIIQVT